MTDDLRDVVRACLRHLVLEDIASSPTRYAHLPLCVLDAVLAPRTRYEGVVRSVERYASLTGLAGRAYCASAELPAVQQSLSDFIAYGRSRGSEVLATEIGHRGVTAGVRKAEVALKLAEALRDGGIETIEDFRAAWDERPAELRSVITGVRGVGEVTRHYLLMLTGDDDGVKPDVMIRRFVSYAVGRPVSEAGAEHLVRAAARELAETHPKITPRTLDASIWGFQRALRRHWSA